MTQLDEHGRPEPPPAAGETDTLLGFLEYQRATLAWKCAGLDAAGLRAKVAVSSMTLGGMLKHLANVEDWWCSRWLHGRDRHAPWDTVDWETDPDWDWHPATEDTPEQLRALWQDAVARSRTLVAEALADGGLDQLARRTWPDGRAPVCDGSCSTWSRSTRGTMVMPTSFGSRWTEAPGNSRDPRSRCQTPLSSRSKSKTEGPAGLLPRGPAKCLVKREPFRAESPDGRGTAGCMLR